MPTPAEQESTLLRAGPLFPAQIPTQALLSMPRVCEKYIPAVSVLTTAASPVTLFNVSGLVIVKVVATSDGSAVTSTSDTGTLAVGISGATTLLLGTTTINTTNFPSGGAIQIDTSPTVHGEVLVAANLTGALIDSNIILTIATNSMLLGSLRYVCLWQPMSANSSVTPA